MRIPLCVILSEGGVFLVGEAKFACKYASRTKTVYDHVTRTLIRSDRVREHNMLPYTKLLWRCLLPLCVILSGARTPRCGVRAQSNPKGARSAGSRKRFAIREKSLPCRGGDRSEAAQRAASQLRWWGCLPLRVILSEKTSRADVFESNFQKPAMICWFLKVKAQAAL